MIIKVEDVPKFFGQPGKINKNLAVQILDYIKRRENEADE